MSTQSKIRAVGALLLSAVFCFFMAGETVSLSYDMDYFHAGFNSLDSNSYADNSNA